jgi:hypothetical protein
MDNALEMTKIIRSTSAVVLNYLDEEKLNDAAERGALRGAHLIGLHLAFDGKTSDDAIFKDPKGAAGGVAHEKLGVWMMKIGFLTRWARFLPLPSHAATHENSGGGHELLGYRGDKPGMGEFKATGALKIYLAMNEAEEDEGYVSDKSIKARAFWKTFLEDRGIVPSADPGNRSLTNPFDFADQWRQLQALPRALEDFVNRTLDFSKDTPSLFNQEVLEWSKGGKLFESDAKASRTKEAKTKTAEIAKERKDLEQNSFKEQLMLMANIESIARQNTAPDKFAGGFVSLPYQYETFCFLRNHDPGVSLENKVYAFKGKKEFLDMTNQQISALVPYFRMFIVYGNKDKREEVEVPFQGTFTDPKEVLDNNRSRTLGFQNFDWTYEGKYLETAKKQIESNLRLYGDNLGVFNKVIGEYDPASKNQRDGFKALAAATGGAVGGAGAVLQAIPPKREIRYADLLTRDINLAFKVQAGWAVPHGVPEDLISSDLKTAINNNIVTLIMELVEHTFEFEQNGTFGLNLRYKSRIMGGLNNIDILEAKKEKEKFSLAERKFELSVKRKFSKELNVPGTPIFGSEAITPAEVKSFAQKHFPTAAAKAERELTQFLEKSNVARQRQSAASIVAQMIANRNKKRTGKNISQILSHIEDRDRLFHLEIRTLDFANYFKGLAEKTDMQKELNSIDGTLSDKERKKERDKIVLKYARKETTRRAEIASSAVVGSKRTGDNRFPKLTSKELNARPSSGASGHRSGTFKLPYVYFGDLIEAALFLAGDQYKAEDATLILGTMPFRKTHIQVSTDIMDFANLAELGQTAGDKIIQLPLVDVPISLRNYNAWITEEYIKKPATKIELSSFIIGAFNHLIKPAFSGETDHLKLVDSQKTHLAVNSNTFSSDCKVFPLYGQVTVDELSGIAISNSPRAKATRNFVLFSANQAAKKLKKPTLEEVRNGEGIMLSLGRDRGLVKTANFSKVNMPNVVAARFMADSGANEKLDKIKEPYDVDLAMVGNNLFSQGVNFWLSPTVPSKGGKKIAKELGLGGYYVTTQASMKIDMTTGFTTTLHGKLQNFSASPEDVKKITAPGLKKLNDLKKEIPNKQAGANK